MTRLHPLLKWSYLKLFVRMSWCHSHRVRPSQGRHRFITLGWWQPGARRWSLFLLCIYLLPSLFIVPSHLEFALFEKVKKNSLWVQKGEKEGCPSTVHISEIFILKKLTESPQKGGEKQKTVYNKYFEVLCSKLL